MSRASGNDVGSYGITQGTLNNSNYLITFVSGVQFTINPRSITVVPTTGQSKVYGNNDPTLQWTLTSGSLAYSDTLNGTMKRDAGENVGNYAIHQGTLSASSNYIMTFQENGVTFGITKRSITVAADDKSKVYGNTDPTLTYQISSGSLVSGDTLTGNITRSTGENVGSYAITQGTLNASGNYTLTFVNATFTISRRPVTVTANSGQTKIYGDANPTPYTWTLTSGTMVGSDTLSGTLSRQTGENVASYNITQGTLNNTNNPNYNITFVSKTFTITKRPISITPDSGQTKIYGNNDPTFTWHVVTGNLVGTDTLSGSLSRSGGNNVGNYAIAQGSLNNSNYQITFVSGPTFAITARPITVAPTAGQSKVYGNSDPTFTWQLTEGTSLAYSDTLTGSMTRATGENVGSYAITKGTLTASSNYTMTFVNGSFAITPRPITVAPSAGQSKVYGNSDPTFTWQLTGGTSLAYSDTLSGSMTRVAGENVGNYTISQGTLTASSNYTMTFVNGSFAITPRPITVAPSAGQSKVYGNNDPTFAWYVSSGSLVGTDTLTGSMTRVAGENVGNYTISQGTLTASSNYTMTFVNGSFAITSRPITVAPSAGQSKVYGNNDPTFAWYVSSGSLVGTDTLTGSMTRATGENVGSYAITKGTLTASSNYTMTFVNGSFAITPRPITVTADSGQKIYGDTDPVLTWQLTGGSFVGTDTLIGNMTRATGENVGSYTILQGALGNSNYAITFIGNTFTITPRPITVASNIGQGKVYGNIDPALTWYISSGSLIGSDTLTGNLTRESGENVGTYVIRQGTLTPSANYTMIFVEGQFTITPRAITIAADNGQSKVYGTSDPGLSWHVSSGSFVGTDTLTGSLTRNPGETVGSYSILQGSLANNNYTITFTTGVNFTITPAPITVTADSGQSKVYGNGDPGLTYQITSGTLVGSDTLSGALSRIAGENVGNYAITRGSLDNSNYLILFVSADFSITTRDITITANSGQSKVYGNGDPGFTWQITSGSLANGDSVSGALSRIAGENVGNYTIIQGTLTPGSNYRVTYIAADFAITTRAITVSSNSGLTKIYGDADPTLMWQITSGSLAFTDGYTGILGRDNGENTGNYATTIGTLSFGNNYAVTFVSNGFTITARSITVAADNSGKVYGDADPTLTWHITSGSLAFSDTFTGSLTRAPGEDVATYAITQGTLALDSNYNLSFTAGNFIISSRTITVTADNQTKTYGNPDPALTYQITSGSLAFSDTFTGTLTRTSGEDVSSYAILQGTLELNNNYTLTFVTGNLTITQRAITVTGDTLSKTYGDLDPALTYQITSGSLAFSDSFTGSLSRTPGENVGSYTVTQGTLALNNNYALTYINGQLTIGKRDITITADTKSKTETQNDPALTWTVTNLVSGDTASGSLVRESGEAPGTYAIEKGTLTYGDNYNETFVEALFTINDKVTISITIDAQSKVYGTTDPGWTFTISGLDTANYTYTATPDRNAGENVGNYLIFMSDFQIFNKNTGDNETTLFNINVTNHYLTITPASVTVTPDSGQSKVYDGTSCMNPAYSYTGLLPGDTIIFGGSLSGCGIHVGTYEIEQGTLYSLNPNYQIVFTTGITGTITPRTIAVQADNQSRIYGDNDPALTYTITGGSLVSGDSFSGSLSRDPGNPVGTYMIRQNTLTLGNDYQIVFTEGNFSITPRTVTITVDPGQSRQYDATSDASITYTFSNAAYGETGFIAGNLTQNGIDVGTYDINMGTLYSTSTNYTLILASGGTYQITPRQIDITTNAGQGKTYGDADPGLTWTLTGGSIVDGRVPTGALERIVGENVGDYAINIGTLSYGSNYAITFHADVFRISARAIEITADNKSKVYGDSDSSLTYQITSGSLVSGDSFSGSLTRNSGEDVNTYAITQGTLALNANYILTFINANFSITPRPITIGANSGQGKIYGDNDPALTWYVASGNLVGGDTLQGALERTDGKNVGTYAILQGTLNNPNYTVSFLGGTNFTITQRTITVTTNAGQGKSYGDADGALTWTITSGSLVGSDTLDGTLSRDTGEDVGLYAINRGTLDNSNYNIIFNGANFAITPRNITITPDAGQGKTYGDADGTLSWAITSGSLMPGDSISGTLSRIAGESVANYSITSGSISAGTNYNITFSPGTYNITPRTITITVDPGQSKTYGDADPTFAWQIVSGNLVFGDTLSGTPGRIRGENVGNYAFTQGTLGNPNYTLLLSGSNTFAITPRSITIEANNVSRPYGQSDPSLTYRIISGSLAAGDFFTGELARQNGSQPGAYWIYRNTLGINSNYLISYIPGVFTITPAQNATLNYYQEYVDNDVFIRRDQILQDESNYNRTLDREPEPWQLERDQMQQDIIRMKMEDSELLQEINDIEIPEESIFDFGEKAGIFRTLFDKTLEKVLNFS